MESTKHTERHKLSVHNTFRHLTRPKKTLRRLEERAPPELNSVVQVIIPTQDTEAPLSYTHSFQKHGETECPTLNLKEQNPNPLRMQRYIRQVFFIVPKHKWTLFSFPSLFIKTLAVTAPWIPEVFYLSLFSVLSSCNKIYLSGISCSASRIFFFFFAPAIAGIMYPSRLQQ